MGLESDRNVVNAGINVVPNIQALDVTPGVRDMQQALQSGFVTADEIAEKMSQREALKNQLQTAVLKNGLAEQAIMPDAIKLKAAQTQAALAMQPDVTSLAHLQMQGQTLSAQDQLADAKYGGAITAFRTLAPLMGTIQQPTLADGSPDYATMAKQGATWQVARVAQADAEDRLKPIRQEPTKKQVGKETVSGVRLFNARDEDVSPGSPLWKELQTKRTAFSRLQAGQATVSPAASSVPAPTAPAPASLSAPQLPAQSAPMPGPASAVSATPAGPRLGHYDPELGYVTGHAVESTQTPEEMTRNMAESRALLVNIDNILPSVASSVGPAKGSGIGQAFVRVGAALGVPGAEKLYADQDRLRQLINHQVQLAAKNLHGNLSDKDVRFLMESLPGLGSTPEVMTQWLQQFRAMTDLNVKVLEGQAQRGASTLPGSVQSDADFEKFMADWKARANVPAATPSANALTDRAKTPPLAATPLFTPGAKGWVKSKTGQQYFLP